jgi:tetratricopeptide (TPR) repeat protein
MDDWLDLSDLVDHTHDLLDMGLYEDARQLLDHFAHLYRGDWEVPYLYSRIAIETDKPQIAIERLHESLKLGGHNPDCYLGLFYAYNDVGQMRKGARYLLRARSRFPDNDQVLSALIWYYGETNRFAQALAVFQRARAQSNDNPDIFRNAGLIYQRIGDHPSAAQCFKRAIDIAPLSDELHDLLADLYVLMGQAPKAIEVYEEFLKRSPNNVRALSRLVFCLAQNGDADRALATAKRTTELYPNSPAGYVDLAYVYLNSGNTTQALGEVERALSVAPLEGEAYRVKAIALSEEDRDDEALAAFQQALSLDPKNPEVLRDYYHHLRKVGDYTAMERTVRSVIRQERPYCVEDWWFLADHYWEEGRPLKAFACLNQAHKSMPGERELLPPLISIMLDQGHASYAMPYLLGYVDRAGWDDSLKAFTRHRGLRDHMSQESMRFVRYYAERNTPYRAFVFRHYLLRLLALAPFVLLPATGWLCYVLAGSNGVVACLAASLALFLSARLAMYLVDGPPLPFARFFRRDA